MSLLDKDEAYLREQEKLELEELEDNDEMMAYIATCSFYDLAELVQVLTKEFLEDEKGKR